MLDWCRRCNSIGLRPIPDPDVETKVCLHCGHRVYGEPVKRYSGRFTPRYEPWKRAHEELADERRREADKLWRQGKDRHQIADRLGVSHRSTYRYV